MNTVNEQPILPTGLRYGLIGGLLFITWVLVKNLSGMMMNTMAGFVDILVYPIVIYLAIKALRTLQGGQISLGKAVAVGTLACVVVGLMGGIFNYIYFNFIDPSAIQEVVNVTTEMMEGLGLDDEVIEEAAESVSSGFTLPRSILGGLGGGTIIGLIGSLIGGAVMKKDAPDLV